MVKPARTALATTGKKSYPQLPRNVQRTAKAICYVDLVWLLSLLAPRARDTEVPASQIFLSLSLYHQTTSTQRPERLQKTNTPPDQEAGERLKMLMVLCASTSTRSLDLRMKKQKPQNPAEGAPIAADTCDNHCPGSPCLQMEPNSQRKPHPCKARRQRTNPAEGAPIAADTCDNNCPGWPCLQLEPNSQRKPHPCKARRQRQTPSSALHGATTNECAATRTRKAPNIAAARRQDGTQLPPLSLTASKINPSKLQRRSGQ
jgi:hypothetical protein